MRVRIRMDWQMAAVILLTVCAVLLVILLIRQAHQEKARQLSAQRLEGLGNQIADEILDALDSQRAQNSEDRHAQTQELTAMISAIGQAQQHSMEGTRQSVGQMDMRMEQFRQDVTGQIGAMREQNERQLSQMRQTVDDKLSESLDRRLTESFAQVSERLEQVWRGLGEMQTLAAGVGDLKKVLTNVKTRGTWGEVQLQSLLEQVLSPGQWAANVHIPPSSREMVEFAIRLPGQGEEPVWLPIDSKFPQEDWLRMQEASDRADREAVDRSRRALMARIRAEAKDIAGKYIVPPYSTDFAILFVPVEGLYAELLRDIALVEELQREQRVVIAGPATLAALLNALQMGFRTLAIEQRSGEVWALLNEVKRDFGRFAVALQQTRDRLQKASEDIENAYSSTRMIQKRLAGLEAGADQPAVCDKN